MLITALGCFTGTNSDVEDRLAALEARSDLSSVEARLDELEQDTGVGAVMDALDDAIERIDELEAENASLRADLDRLQTMVQVTDDGDLILGSADGWDGSLPERTSANDVIVTGANLFLLNGEGGSATVNGYGNLVIGYNESSSGGAINGSCPTPSNTGSHNLILGPANTWTSWGTLVVGLDNCSRSALSTVLGQRSRADSTFTESDLDPDSGNNLVVGADNASGDGAKAASVIGGDGNKVNGQLDVIVGGNMNLTPSSGLSFYFGTNGSPWGGELTSSVVVGCADSSCSTVYYP